MQDKEENKMNRINKKAMLSFCFSLAVFSVAALVIALALSLGRCSRHGEEARTPKNIKGESFNVLLIMTDYLPETFGDYDPQSVANVFGTVSDGTGTRRVNAESILLVRFDAVYGELTLTPFSGKTLVSVKGQEKTLDSVASDFGTELLIQKIHAMTGLEIDKYMVFTPDSASEAFDLLGEVTYKNKYSKIWQDQALGIDINIEQGSQKFDGKKMTDLVRYYSYPSNYTDKDDVLLEFTKKFAKNLTDDFTYDELCGIMSSISEMSYGKAELTGNQIELLHNSAKLDVKLLPLCGSLDEMLRFIPDEAATLEAFKQYRRIYF
jgi:anionic cell wall polymer biosynthesis LytR-Cps2A-Psr (LCP) family protein